MEGEKEVDWAIHLRLLTQSARDNPGANDPANNEEAVLQTVTKLYEMCQAENSADLIARVYPPINKLFQRCIASVPQSRSSTGLLLLNKGFHEGLSWLPKYIFKSILKEYDPKHEEEWRNLSTVVFLSLTIPFQLHPIHKLLCDLTIVLPYHKPKLTSMKSPKSLPLSILYPTKPLTSLCLQSSHVHYLCTTKLDGVDLSIHGNLKDIMANCDTMANLVLLFWSLDDKGKLDSYWMDTSYMHLDIYPIDPIFNSPSAPLVEIYPFTQDQIDDWITLPPTLEDMGTIHPDEDQTKYLSAIGLTNYTDLDFASQKHQLASTGGVQTVDDDAKTRS
eukprot:Gb_09370 [translate_table: standard]